MLFGGTVFALLAGRYYWFPKMTGRMMDETLGKWSFWIIVIGFNMTFLSSTFSGSPACRAAFTLTPTFLVWA